MKQTNPVLLRINLKLIGWWPVAVSVLILGAFFILQILVPSRTSALDITDQLRVV